MEAKRWTLGVVLAAAVSLFGLIQADASPFSSYVLSDDLGNVVNGTAPEPGDWSNDSGSEDGSGADNGSDDGVKDNNGHGNNADGVDSSNKGNSKTGEDTVCDDGTVCDDEMSKTNSGGKKK
jgi:hypothetical protein